MGTLTMQRILDVCHAGLCDHRTVTATTTVRHRADAAHAPRTPGSRPTPVDSSFAAAIRDELNPGGVLENVLIDLIIRSAWTLRPDSVDPRSDRATLRAERTL